MEEHDSLRFRTERCLLARFMSALPTQRRSEFLEQLDANWETSAWERLGGRWGVPKATLARQKWNSWLKCSFCLSIFIFIEQPLPCPSQFPHFLFFFPFFKCSLIPSMNWCSLCVGGKKKISLFFCLFFFLLLPLAQFIIFLSCHSVW